MEVVETEGQRLEKSENARGRSRRRGQWSHQDVRPERKDNTQLSKPEDDVVTSDSNAMPSSTSRSLGGNHNNFDFATISGYLQSRLLFGQGDGRVVVGNY